MAESDEVRERRRQKILQNSESRMKKLLGENTESVSTDRNFQDSIIKHNNNQKERDINGVPDIFSINSTFSKPLFKSRDENFQTNKYDSRPKIISFFHILTLLTLGVATEYSNIFNISLLLITIEMSCYIFDLTFCKFPDNLFLMALKTAGLPRIQLLVVYFFQIFLSDFSLYLFFFFTFHSFRDILK